MAGTMDSGNTTTAALFEKEGPAQSREAPHSWNYDQSSPKSLFPLNGADGFGREVVAHAADAGDLVLVQKSDGLAELKLQVLGQANHVVMGLHAVLGLQDVGIDGALGEEADLVANPAGLLFGSMGMRHTYANAPSYDFIICRTRCVSHRCDKAFCRGGNFSYCRGQLGFGSHLGSIANRLFLYTFCVIVCHAHKFQSRVTGVQLLLLLPAVGRWTAMATHAFPCR